MLIVPSKKAVLLSAREPRQLTTLIPHARIVEFRGRQLVAVPHRIEETKLLRNIGIKVPSPLLHYYEWSREPFAAQRQTAAFLTLNPRAFVLNSLGTGKTYAALAAFDFLRRVRESERMLVISPLSTLERTWHDEIFQYFPHLSVGVVHGTRERRLKILADKDFDVYVINHDGIKVDGIVEHLEDRPDINVIVVDEIASFRNASTDRWRKLHRITSGTKDKPQLFRRVWGLTGTPIPNAPTDAWAQCRLICPENVPKFYGRFRDQVMRQVSQFKWVPRENALELVEDAMQPAVRFTRDQCIDLPPVVYQERSVELTPQQKKLYVEMVRRLQAEAAEGTITAVNEGVKLGKLLQIACGAVYGDDDNVVQAAADTRIAVVEEVIEQSEGKVIVFAPFRAVLDMLQHRLESTGQIYGYSVARVDGQVSKPLRDQIFADFQRAEQPRVLIAQPAAMSHGLTLTSASTIVWYGPVTSHEIFEQANGRITRPGQQRSQLIVTIEGCAAERSVYAKLRAKASVQGALLDLIKEKGYE